MATEALELKLAAETGTLCWTELQRHFARGAVVVVSSRLALLDVAQAMARDDKAALADLAFRLGSDVAYFLEGGLCLGEGRGERISPLDDLPPLSAVIVLPPLVSLTAEVYGRFEPSLTSEDKDSRIMRFLQSRELGSLENSLERTVFRLYPQLQDIKRSFQNQGAALSLVTGTGSAVFGIFRSRAEAERGWNEAQKRHPSVLVETVSRGEYGKGMSAGV